MKNASPSDTLQESADPEQLSEDSDRGKHAKASRPSPRRWLRIFIPALLIVAWLTGAAVGGPYFGRVSEV